MNKIEMREKMEMKEKKARRIIRGKAGQLPWKLALWLMILAVFVMIYIVNRWVPFMMDDEWYSTRLFSDEPLRGPGDILPAQIWHYNNWGGRSMAHGLLQAILMAGEHAADILNVIAVGVVAWLLCLTSGQKKAYIWLGAVVLMIGCNANWKMSMFWQAGAANYLYMSIPILLFFLSCLQALEGKSPAGVWVWMLPLGLVAGWTNENIGPVLWLLSLYVLFRRRRDKERGWLILASLGSLAGSAIMIAAPGNFVRSQETGLEYGTIWQIFLRMYGEGKGLAEYLFPLLLVLAGLLLAYVGVWGEGLEEREILFLAAALLSWGAMLLSPHYPDRAAFGTMIFLICVILSLAGKLAFQVPGSRTMLGLGLGLVWVRAMYVLLEFWSISLGYIR